MEQGILPSRKELLTRIELMCDLDSSFISVTGDAGIGKSALLEFFIEHHCLGLKKCFVSATENSASYEIRENILSQLVPGSTFDSHLTLGQNLATLTPGQSFKGIFVIDNAQYVADDVFYDLIELMNDSAYQFSVIYAQVRDDVRQADFNARKALIEIHPEPLDEAESQMLLGFYYRDALNSSKAQLKAFIKDAQGIPAQLLLWQQDTDASKSRKKAKSVAKSTKSSSNTSKSHTQLLVIVVGGLLLTVIAVAAWYFMPPSQQGLREQLRAKVEEQQTQPQSTQAQSQSQQDGNEVANNAVDGQSIIKTTQDDEQQSEQGENLDELLAQPWDDNRQIRPEHKFDSPEDKQAPEPKVIEVINIAADTDGENDKQTPTSVSEPANQVKEKAEAEPQNEIKETQVTSQENKLMDNEWFLAQAASGYMVQLAGVSDKKVLDSFIQRHQLQDKAKIYQTRRNGKPWYVITIGSFANMAAARAGIQQLSSSLKSSSPWAKSIKAIQSEIVNANN